MILCKLFSVAAQVWLEIYIICPMFGALFMYFYVAMPIYQFLSSACGAYHILFKLSQAINHAYCIIVIKLCYAQVVEALNNNNIINIKYIKTRQFYVCFPRTDSLHNILTLLRYFTVMFSNAGKLNVPFELSVVSSRNVEWMLDSLHLYIYGNTNLQTNVDRNISLHCPWEFAVVITGWFPTKVLHSDFLEY